MNPQRHLQEFKNRCKKRAMAGRFVENDRYPRPMALLPWKTLLKGKAKPVGFIGILHGFICNMQSMWFRGCHHKRVVEFHAWLRVEGGALNVSNHRPFRLRLWISPTVPGKGDEKSEAPNAEREASGSPPRRGPHRFVLVRPSFMGTNPVIPANRRRAEAALCLLAEAETGL